MGFEPPSWQAAALGVRPLPREPDDIEPGCVRQGWQHEASSRVEQQFRPVQVQVLIRSQGGPGGGAALTAVPTCSEKTIPSHLFRVVPRRLRQSSLSDETSFWFMMLKDILAVSH